jgi:hypothetical protein
VPFDDTAVVPVHHSILPLIDGTDKQVAWAYRLRGDRLAECAEVISTLRGEVIRLRAEGDEEAAYGVERVLWRFQSAFYRVREQRSAKWWIDNRDLTAEQLLEGVRL